MAKVTLRLYNREIEGLIDRGQVEEAIAHCKHILQAYPKHIETYRLLAKAFLESQRYGEAADVFQRVLSSVPDDFVSQVGMSIIREDEGNLDEAIWHMERAFEVQPSNNAVQDELRRLYQRRDGVELSRIRLTRGALARMYSKGDLYQQAIAEIRATLVTEPVRPDLQVLLARMCFQAGQRIESTEICSELLSKYPYCYEANRILSQILPTTTHAEDAKIYLQRIYALDPYAAFITSTTQSSKDVPDNAVMIERYEYKGGVQSETEQPEWASSLGLVVANTGSSTEPLPEWLSGSEQPSKSVKSEMAPPQDAAALAATPTEGEESLIPDWMKSAGWMEAAEGTTEAGAETPVFSEEPEAVAPPVESEAAPANIPAWLKEIAPSTPSEEKEAENAPAMDWMSEEGTPDWLKEIKPEPESPEANKEGLAPEIPAPTASEELPDWLKAMDIGTSAEEQPAVAESEAESTEVHPEPSQELPQWLQDLKTMAPSEAAIGSQTAPKAEELPSTPETTTPQAAGIGEVPEWLSAMASEPGPESLPSTEAFPTVEPAAQEIAQPLETAPQPAVEIPEWLQELGKEPSTPVPAEVKAQAAVEEPLKAPEAAPSEAAATMAPAEAESQPMTEGVPSMAEQDAALAWLEGLAAKHGAEEEELFVKPEDRIETPPAWLQRPAEELTTTPTTAAEAPEAVAPVPTEMGTVSAEIPGGVPEQTEAPQPVEAMPAAPIQEVSQQPPEAVQTITPEAVIPTPTPSVEEAGVSAPVMDETAAALAWLESLAAKQGAEEETLFVKPEDRTEQPPEWVQKAAAEQAVETPPSAEAAAAQFTEAAQPPEEITQPVEQVQATPEIAETPVTPPSEEIPQPVEQIPAAPETLEAPAPIAAEEVEQPVEPISQLPPIEEAPAAAISPAEDLPDWLKELTAIPDVTFKPSLEPEVAAQQPAEQAPVSKPEVPEQTVMPVTTQPAEELPDWLQELEMPTEVKAETTQAMEMAPTTPEPAGTAVEKPAQPEEKLPEWLQGFEEPVAAEPPVAAEISQSWLVDVSEPAPEEFRPAGMEAVPEAPEEVAAEQPVAVSAPTGEEAPEAVDFPNLLQESQAAFVEGKIESALKGYRQLVNEGYFIDETIHDLRDALYRFPVDISIWQVLGDAYVRSNRLQDALDAFTKAEELLR